MTLVSTDRWGPQPFSASLCHTVHWVLLHWGPGCIIVLWKTSRAHTPKYTCVTLLKWSETQSCPTHCDCMDCSSLLGSSVHGILQARILEWIAIPFSRGSSGPRDQIWVSCTAGRFFTIWATREAPVTLLGWAKLGVICSLQGSFASVFLASLCWSQEDWS